ncbi:MAG: glutamine synthetase III [Clostridiales bacterium]|nr:glutamine synthetase III [Clostridiales bacterium]
MSYLSTIFGSNVFNDSVMRERLPKETYKVFKKTLDEGKSMDASIAEIVAGAMKDWALEKGATHFTHWFQPMTGITAEKHDSFISPTDDGKVILEFSGKELIKGEPDASSFPNGGLRATFEARGYTAWDCTSPAFVKDNILCIPTAFCSYNGEALDKKTPLLRSMEVISEQSMRVLKAFGNTTSSKVISSVGPEQEYFLIDKALYEKRMDLMFTGRTLFGAMPPKGQELDDHYFGSLKERVSDYMKELNEELWKLGISAKTQHNEVSPAQHELAPIYSTTNIATDHNQLIMEMMKKVALRHNLVCLLHEKPFAGVNGSGKHNNWSLGTDDGMNLLEPGKTPHENAQFLVFLAATIKAVDKYAELLRLTAAVPGNDHRLGANEAPPAIISIFLGAQLSNILTAIENDTPLESGTKKPMTIGVTALPPLPKDSTDRNRTSPFAFTGNKFEFRMTPSSGSISGPNFILNTTVADTLSEIADALESADDLDNAVQAIIKDIMKNHKRIIFDGNNYSDEWVEEAKARGLSNIKNMVDSVKTYIDDKNVNVLNKFNVLTKEEIHARYEIQLETYSKTINIEALTTLSMAKTEILPSTIRFASSLASSFVTVKSTGLSIDTSAQESLLTEVSVLNGKLSSAIAVLEEKVTKAQETKENLLEQAELYRDEVFTAMNDVRCYADQLELLCDSKLWPFPTYADLLFRV